MTHHLNGLKTYIGAFNVIALVAMVKLVKGWFGKKKVKDDRANSK